MILNQQGRCSLHLCKGRHSTSFHHGSRWNKTISTSLLCHVLVFRSPQWFEEDKALPWDFLVQFFWDLAENPGYLIVWLFFYGVLAPYKSYMSFILSLEPSQTSGANQTWTFCGWNSVYLWPNFASWMWGREVRWMGASEIPWTSNHFCQTWLW